MFALFVSIISKSRNNLIKYRKFALVGVLILAAVITPPDIASQIIVAIPIVILYQISIYISGVVIKRNKWNYKQ